MKEEISSDISGGGEKLKASKRSDPKPKREGTVPQRLTAIIVEQLGVEEEEVVLSASFVDDLNADSLDLVELIMSLEEEFAHDLPDFKISDEEAEGITTVQAALDFLIAHGVLD